MVKCPGCGSGMAFDPVSQMVKCDHCDTRLEPESASPTLMVGKNEIYNSTLYTCPQCGGEIVSDSDTVATFCSYCGASVMLESKVVQMVAPSHVIPFKVPMDNCKSLYKKLINKAIFAPSYMKSEDQINKMRGIYMPYWNYDFAKNGSVVLNGKKSYRRGDYIYTDYYRLSADIDAKYDGISFDASSSFSDELSNSIAPYIISDSKKFNASYLSGFYADTADVSVDVYTVDAYKAVEADLISYCKRIPEFSRYSVDGNGNIPDGLNLTSKEVDYYPVWFLANRSGDKVSYAVINGQTGKISADIPIDYKKYILGSLLLAIPIALVLNLFLTLTPVMMIVIAIIFSIFGLAISNSQCNMQFRRENNLNDKGMLSKHRVSTVKNSMPLKEKRGIIIKPIIAIVFDALILFSQTPYDYVYYTAVTISMILIVFTFIDIMKGHNKLTQRKPQQFGRRGGDENASI